MTLQEYMAFMISKETENIQSSEEIESAFRALSKDFRPYVTAEELYAVCYSIIGFRYIYFVSHKNNTFSCSESDARAGRVLYQTYETVH